MKRWRWIVMLWVLATTQVVAADSIAADGFWTRYNKHPHMVAVDTTFAAKEAAREAKKVRFIYNVDFTTYFDNREYHAPYQTPQTIFNFRLSPEVGVRIRDGIGGKHELIAGVSYTQRLGGNWKDVQFDPIAFYHFQYKGFDAGLGAIPYTRRIAPMPDWLMYDSLVYMHPNIQGALLMYQDKRGYVELMCDWRGAQTAERREMFRIMLDGQYRYKWLIVGGLADLNHKAGFAEPNYEAVMDDAHLNANIGANVSSYTPFDSLTIRAGYIFGWERDRGVNENFYNHGLIIELYANWWFLGLKNTFYYGDNQQPLRPRNPDVALGDPFYQAHLYNRTDIFAYLYRNSFVNFYFSWNMHYDGHSLQHQQQLIARFNLNGLYHKDHLLRGLFDK